MTVRFIVETSPVDPCSEGPVLEYINKDTNVEWQNGSGDAPMSYPEDDWRSDWQNDGETIDTNSRLAVNGSWHVDFRTENLTENGEIRIYCATVDGLADPGTMDVDGESGNPLTVEIEINGSWHTGIFQGLGGGADDRRWYFDDIDEGDGDISQIRFSALNGDPTAGFFYVTDIEFYVDSCDENPGGDWGDGG